MSTTGTKLKIDQEDHQRLEDLHPPRLDVVDVGERDATRHARVDLHRARARPGGSRCRVLAGAGLQEGGARGHVGAQVDLADDAAAVGARGDAVAVVRRQARGVGGVELDDLARGEELQRRGDVDLGRGPDRAVRPEAQAPVRRRRVGRHLQAERRPLSRLRPQRGVALGPAHAAPADLVEREAGVERDRGHELR